MSQKYRDTKFLYIPLYFDRLENRTTRQTWFSFLLLLFAHSDGRLHMLVVRAAWRKLKIKNRLFKRKMFSRITQKINIFVNSEHLWELRNCVTTKRRIVLNVLRNVVCFCSHFTCYKWGTSQVVMKFLENIADTAADFNSKHNTFIHSLVIVKSQVNHNLMRWNFRMNMYKVLFI